MGYTTYFVGKLDLDRELDENTYDFLLKFSRTRRMKRNVDSVYGIEGEFYVSGGGNFGQDFEDNIIDYNQPPETQPSLWCHWIPSEDRKHIVWDGGEKFYYYIEWLKYIINNFLIPQNYTLNGNIKYCGEDITDFGVIFVVDNNILVKKIEVDNISFKDAEKLLNDNSEFKLYVGYNLTESCAIETKIDWKKLEQYINMVDSNYFIINHSNKNNEWNINDVPIELILADKIKIYTLPKEYL